MKSVIILLSLLLGTISLLPAEEGMFPLSHINKINLKAAGFEITSEDIFSPDSPSLSDAIVKLGGCTGSFISDEGLILTNHHCAFYAVSQASTPEHDYLKNGFLARNRSDEIEAKGYTVRITQSYSDVSPRVLARLDTVTDFAQRTQIIKKRIKEIVKQAEKEHPGMRAEVSEMFAGQSYVLFLYTYLKDVRMVYVPPRAIGEFGGDVDNWEWPRHNGDFSILRAYVGPDGKPAEFSKDNVPYHPKKFLTINPAGVDENDLVFLLGYPGRTYRHRTASFIRYQEQVRMPFIRDWYQWQIRTMLELGKANREVALKYSSTVKSLANTEKNYRGKLLGLKRLNLVGKKEQEEAAIQRFLRNNPKLFKQYGNVLSEINRIYEQQQTTAQHDLILSYFTRSVQSVALARTLYKAVRERAKADLERESAYMDRNFEATKKRTLLRLERFYAPGDKKILLALLRRAAQLPSTQRIAALDRLFSLDQPESLWHEKVNRAYEQSELFQTAFIRNAFNWNEEQLEHSTDPFIQWVIALEPELKTMKKQSEQRSGALNSLSARWAEVKRAYQKTAFIPDANGTFRLTYGHIRGYSPADAVYHLPQTTVQGILEKNTGTEPFNAPERLLTLIREQDFGIFKSKKKGTLPVGILYDTDTTGGNSGSPVMDARGRLVGLNFDRSFEATINDFAWNESYSRSIGVDIRYILWVIQKYAGAGYLLDEMGVTH